MTHLPRQRKTSPSKVSNRRAAHEKLCVYAKEGAATYTRSQAQGHGNTRGRAIHRDRTRRTTNEHARAEGHVNGIGSFCKAPASLCQSYTQSDVCGVPDRESNEVKYLATELIEERKQKLQSGQLMSGPPSDHQEVILVDKQKSWYGGPENVLCKMRVLAHEQKFIIIFHFFIGGRSPPSEGRVVCARPIVHHLISYHPGPLVAAPWAPSAARFARAGPASGPG